MAMKPVCGVNIDQSLHWCDDRVTTGVSCMKAAKKVTYSNMEAAE